MPRFTPSKYSPTRDTSESCRTIDPSRVVLLIRRREDGTFGCPCGCGEAPRSAKSIFKMGHDARLRGKLIRAHLTGTEVIEIYVDANGRRTQRPPKVAMAIASQYDWEEALDTALLRREGKNREVLQRALNSKRLIRVGRWEYTGQVVAVYGREGDEEYDVEYVTRQGQKKRVRVPADKALEEAR